jgi:Tfp pilus assembly protein PilO
MASSGALADFGRMTTGRKIAVFVVIGGLIGFLYYRLAYKPLAADVEKAKKAMTAAAASNAQIDADIPKYKKLLERKKALDETIKEQQRALPTGAEIPAFFETLERKVTESGVEIRGFTRRPEENVESFVKVGMDVEINGTFMQIKRFFASLVEKPVKPLVPGEQQEEQERIVTIENLNLGQPTVRNGQIILTAKFAAVTFRQEDAAPTPPTAPGAVPANAPAPSGGSDTSPGPLPSAATPAGAKARTEDAMKKIDDRNRESSKDPQAPGSGSARLKGGL